jgi:hypothetical protein
LTWATKDSAVEARFETSFARNRLTGPRRVAGPLDLMFGRDAARVGRLEAVEREATPERSRSPVRMTPGEPIALGTARESL